MPAPLKNRNAAKPEHQRLKGLFRFRCHPDEKTTIEDAAKDQGLLPSDWARRTLLKAARRARKKS